MIAAAVPEVEIEREMVDAGADVIELSGRNAEIGGEVARRFLHGVTKPDGADRAPASGGPAEHRHWVHVLKQDRVGTQFFHVAADVEQGPGSSEARA